MNKEVTFRSICTVPMDFESADGELERAVNLINETGSLTAALPPTELFRIGAADRVLVIHTVGNDDKHYVILKAGVEDGVKHMQLGYVGAESPESFHPIAWNADAEVYRATALGNTLVVLTSEGIEYFLYRDGAYVPLGSQPPLPELAFFLKGDTESGEIHTPNIGNVNLTLSKGISSTEKFNEEDLKRVNDTFWANLNKGIADEITAKGMFAFPFLVRYGLRLYDGSVTMISSPVLIRPCYGPNIIPIVPNPFDTKEWTHSGIYVVAGKLVTESVGATVESQKTFMELRKWSDIVVSLDVFVSAPIYTYDSNRQIEGFGTQKKGDTTSLMWYGSLPDSITDGNKLIAQTGYILDMPYYSDTEMEEKLKQENLFYLLKSIPLETLTMHDTLYVQDLTPENGYLSSLRSRERLVDDYNSRDKLIAKRAFCYNGRLNLVDLEREPYGGNELRSAVRTITSGEQLWLTAYTCIKIDQQPIWLKGSTFQAGSDFNVPYYFHPNTDATALLIVAHSQASQEPDRYVRLSLDESPVLNGAVYIAPFGRKAIEWTPIEDSIRSIISAAQTNTRIEIRNKIYTSEVNNPFSFGRTGITTVGSGCIYGVSAAAKALSQGQFGQFPLYAFTDEGIWALSVSETGSYSARQPLTRDICTEPDTITQLDTSVMFVSARGIMLLQGSDCVCISEKVNSPMADEDVFDVREAQGIMYDYINSRVVLFRRDCRYSWIYSLRTQGWFLSDTAYDYGLNSYPEAIGVCADDGIGRSVVEVSRAYSAGESVRFELESRPIKLDSYGYKTLNSVICRGTFGCGRFHIEVDGSRNLEQWQRIGAKVASSRILHMHGSPYRYFRIRLSGEIKVGESLAGMSMIYTPRFSRKN